MGCAVHVALPDRRRFLLQASGALVSALSTGCAPDTPTVRDHGSQIGALMEGLDKRRLFNGQLLVAINGEVVYEGAFGVADPRTRRPYTLGTRSCLASLSKPITATAVMILVQQGLLAYDDLLSKYLQGFTDSVGAVTLRHLLTHTSGIPDYPKLNVDRPGVTNAEILKALRGLTGLSFPPGQRYEYSNSGYVLLALIIESVSGQSLPRFLDSRIFDPSGMQATFVLTSEDQKGDDVARGYDETGRPDDFMGMATGESGVYSTVGDLLRFDQALYSDLLVSQHALAEAFVPARVREGAATYGLGWNIVEDEDGKRVWHQGNTAGFRAFIERRLRNRITVIMLTNGGKTDRMAINESIQRILSRRA